MRDKFYSLSQNDLQLNTDERVLHPSWNDLPLDKGERVYHLSSNDLPLNKDKGAYNLSQERFSHWPSQDDNYLEIKSIQKM